MNDLTSMSKEGLEKEVLIADIEIKRQHAELLKAQARLENARAKDLEKN